MKCKSSTVPATVNHAKFFCKTTTVEKWEGAKKVKVRRPAKNNFNFYAFGGKAKFAEFFGSVLFALIFPIGHTLTKFIFKKNEKRNFSWSNACR